MRPFLYSLMIVSCLSLLLWVRPIKTTARERGDNNSSSSLSAMPKQCRPGKTSTEALGWRWKPYTHVRLYYLKNNFSEAEVNAFSRAVNNWNSALKEIDSSIVFTTGGTRESVSEDNASITVMRGIPKGKERLGEIKFYSMSNGVERMVVVISPVVTDLDALTSLMAHEIGHSLGLADCYECKRGTTTMAAFRDNNKGNDVFEPSECDKYVVAAGYLSEHGAQARLSPTTRQ
ncbi:MAG: hypothetical protein QOJ02_1425 [Acidobacteriota bacterium]|nr:hypothetical protein [Acidobacteriota bacterium]